MGNAIFEQYGYKSARDVMIELARDISDGGELIAVTKHERSNAESRAYKYDGGYWLIMYRRGCASSIDYFENELGLFFVMGV